MLLECMSNYYCYEKNHPDPEIRGGPGLPPNFFWPFGPHFGQKMGGGGGGGGAGLSPGSAPAAIPPQSIIH